MKHNGGMGAQFFDSGLVNRSRLSRTNPLWRNGPGELRGLFIWITMVVKAAK
jgi:hypothetical protein